MNTPIATETNFDSQEIKEKTICSVCIATYKRPRLLKELLLSLSRQALPDDIGMEIIVVDNDALKTGKAAVCEFQNDHTIPCHYFSQPKKNISLTRNLAVEKASGEYILFIDDDEKASPLWIHHLLTTLKKYNADGVFGPIMPEFNETTPDWMRRSDLFYGTVSATGIKADGHWTGNCIVSASLIKNMKKPFDASYGISGGEDSNLFDRLERQGARFVYCKEAWVSEFLPPSRTRISYLWLRAMRGGNTHTRRILEFAGKGHPGVRLFMVMKALVFGTISMALVVLFFPSAARRTRWLLKLASNVGRFMAAFGWIYKGYR